MMKNKYSYFIVLLLLVWSVQVYSQEVPLGKCATLVQKIRVQAGAAAQRSAWRLTLPVPAGTLTARVNAHTSGADNEYVIGEIENTPGSSFYLRVGESTLEGNIILRNSKKAYQYYADDAGNAYVAEVDINKVICIDYDKAPDRAGAAQRSAAGESVSAALLTLESFPGGNGCVLLYQCREWPYSGWCNGAAWAYAPGTGTYWQDAWTLVGPCANAAAAIATEAMVVENAISYSPNPLPTNYE